MSYPPNPPDQATRQFIDTLTWYHTIDLGHGLVTPGIYDHRPYLHHYGLPSDLTGKQVLDIGAASGFFAFEFERRGAQVTATELPRWFDHDFGPTYQADQTDEAGLRYLHQPLDVARRVLGSQVAQRHLNIYELSPETVGMFDLVFCGSLLVHLTDPTRAFWNIASVTSDKAIIATVLMPDHDPRPLALLHGHVSGDSWWFPNRTCLELLAVCAGFVGVEWVSEFHLNLRDGSPGPYHGVLHAYKTLENWTPRTVHRDTLLEQQRHSAAPADRQQLHAELIASQQEVARLQALVTGYEQGRLMRLLRWLHTLRARLR
jgi:tRNA (mo5U34)-methyltransferase